MLPDVATAYEMAGLVADELGWIINCLIQALA